MEEQEVKIGCKVKTRDGAYGEIKDLKAVKMNGKMTEQKAKILCGNQSKLALRNMVKALSLLPLLNTPQDEERLKAAKFLLRKQHKGRQSCN